MFIVYRQDDFGHEPIELYHSDYKENADKYAADYKAGLEPGIQVFVHEVPGVENTRSNATKEKAEFEKKNKAQGGN